MHRPDPVAFIHDLRWRDLPEPVRRQARLSLLDLAGVGAAGAATRLSAIIRDHAAEDWPGPYPMLFDGRRAALAATALAGGMTIDALDGHDGFNPAKGHIGCPVFPAALAQAAALGASGEDFLATLCMGYEFGGRAAVAQHASAPDYHTSGSWGAVAAAAACARLLRLGREATRHALGIAEYHGPRSQMMRCIDHPTMLKDGAGWGAMTGVSAAQLAARGFTGAPALIVEEVTAPWRDLGARWLLLEQYYKPYPVCRWAQPPVEGVLALRRAHGLSAAEVARIEVETFHEATRLAVRRPADTEAAQYSTAYPVAVALVRGTVAPEHLAGDALSDPEVLRLSDGLVMTESAEANAAFPARRIARTRLVLRAGGAVETGWLTPRWDADAPPREEELREKFRALAVPALGAARAEAVEAAVDNLEDSSMSEFCSLLFQPINR